MPTILTPEEKARVEIDRQLEAAAGRCRIGIIRISLPSTGWLDKIAETIGLNLSFDETDFQDYFYDEGGLLAARSLFGRETLAELLEELNEALVV